MPIAKLVLKSGELKGLYTDACLGKSIQMNFTGIIGYI